MASLMSNCIQDTVKIEIKAVGESDKNTDRYCTFNASGYTVRFDGYTRLYEAATDEDEDEGKLPEIKAGDALKLKEMLEISTSHSRLRAIPRARSLRCLRKRASADRVRTHQ